MKLERFDHLLLTVRSSAAPSALYRDVLGMEIVTFSEGRIAHTHFSLSPAPA